MQAAQRPLVSEADFLALPEGTSKTELLDGEVVVSPSPTYWHQEVLQRLVYVLRSWAKTRQAPPTIGQAPLDVRFGSGRILQPDAFVLTRPVPRNHQGPILDIPELCIEVLSTDRLYDRITKRLIYAGAGVAELWLVEPAGMIERWTGAGLDRAEEITAELTTPLLPGLALKLPELFAEL